MDRQKPNKNNQFVNPYCTTTDDQYEESEDFDLSENQSSDDGSYSLAHQQQQQNRFRRPQNKDQALGRPYRRRTSFTTSKAHQSAIGPVPFGSKHATKGPLSGAASASASPAGVKSSTSPTLPSSIVTIVNGSSGVVHASSPATPTSLLASEVIPEEMEQVSLAPLPVGAFRKPSESTLNHKSMTVETETVSSVAALAVAAAGGSGASSLKVRRSIDNVNKSLHRGNKKKSSRLGGGQSKAEVFAARVASAVDEAQSSDSDETFVYESNPHEGLGRPRFHTRHSSSSLFSRPLQPSQPPQSQPPQSQPPSAASPNLDSYQTLTLKKRSNPPLDALSRHPSQSFPVDQPHKPNSPQLQPSIQPAPRPIRPGHLPVDNLLSVYAIKESRNLSGLSREGLKISRGQSGLRKQISSHLRGFPSRVGSQAGGGFNPELKGYKSMSNTRRWGVHENEYDEEESIYNNGINGNMIDDDDDFDDFDVDYYEYDENTPLRLTGSVRTKGRKNGSSGGQRAYSPHNYHRLRPNRGGGGGGGGGGPGFGPKFGANSTSAQALLRHIVWLVLLVVAVLGAGFMLGFLLATNKPLHSVSIASVMDVLVSDEELLFDVVVEAVNPGFLGIEVSELSLDVFARSPYVLDDDGGGLIMRESEVGEEEEGTMLLGTIAHFDVPVSFSGGFLSKRSQHAVGHLRLIHPGRNSTSGSSSSVHENGVDSRGLHANQNQPKNKNDVGAYQNGGAFGSNHHSSTNGFVDNDESTQNGDFEQELQDENTSGGGSSQLLDHHQSDNTLTAATSTSSAVAVATISTSSKEGQELPHSISNDEDFDKGQLKWGRVNLHPFELILKGVMRYELPLGGGSVQANSLSKVSFFILFCLI